jgi:ABC-type dipeptide/oligopeptide/nickel transport system permease component
MTQYIFRRLLVALPVMFAVVLVTFVLVQVMPGGPFDTVGIKSMPEQMRRIMERRYGLDKPLYEQFWLYFTNLLRGDLGPMLKLRSQTVNDVVAETFPVSAQLGLMAVIVGFTIGIPAGVIAALGRNTIVDYSATFVAVAGISIPNMVLGPVLILIFGVGLKWFPIAFWGAEPPFILGVFPQPSATFWHHAVLPVLTLGSGSAAAIARLTRASLLEVLGEDYIRTARAKGLREQVVIVGHALKNSLIPVTTLLGPMLAGYLTGSLIVETVFALNGMGRRFVSSVADREYFLLTSLTLIYSVMLILGNIFVDVMYAWLDPRIRFD